MLRGRYDDSERGDVGGPTYPEQMARAVGSWLSGEPFDSGTPEQGPNDFRGERLGLPESGTGSLAGTGRRVAAFFLDWFLAHGLTGLLVVAGVIPSANAQATGALVIWFVIGVAAVRLFGFTPGQLALGCQVIAVDGREHLGLGRALGRSALITLVLPTLFFDTDGRGLQDRFTQSAVVRR